MGYFIPVAVFSLEISFGGRGGLRPPKIEGPQKKNGAPLLQHASRLYRVQRILKIFLRVPNTRSSVSPSPDRNMPSKTSHSNPTNISVRCCCPKTKQSKPRKLSYYPIVSRLTSSTGQKRLTEKMQFLPVAWLVLLHWLVCDIKAVPNERKKKKITISDKIVSIPDNLKKI